MYESEDMLHLAQALGDYDVVVDIYCYQQGLLSYLI